jgi:hypothetical protein
MDMGSNRQLLNILAAGCAGFLVSAAASSAGADNNPTLSAPEPPETELRFVIGLGAGVELTKSVFQHRLRLDLGMHVLGLALDGLAEGAVSGRVLGSAVNGLWIRGGFLAQRFDQDCWDNPGRAPDVATALDAGLAYRRRWPGGSLLAAEAGMERVSRDSYFCNDSLLTATSLGTRVALAGQWPLSQRLAFYGRIGVRTGQHILEIGLLPELWVGLAYEI